LVFLILSTSCFALSKENRIIKASLYPYTIKGITYYPRKVAVGETKEVLASWYGEYFHGRKTAMGEIYNMYGYTAAHKTYPLGTVIRVTNPKNGNSLRLRINDRGPFWNDRGLDLSMGAAEFLGTKRQGVAKVIIEVLSVPDIAKSDAPFEGKKPLKPSYNVGENAVSYATVTEVEKKVPFEIGSFNEKKEAKAYLKKLQKYFPKATVFESNYLHKIKFLLPSNEEEALVELKKLKRLGLITGYAICWSYN
jgi:rare lipoprotein A